MVQDSKVIAALSPADLVVLLRETAGIAVLESAVADGKPVIQAAVMAVNAQTGEVLAGGLPFSIVMFKGANETGYSNIAIGTIVPAAELDIHLPRDYFNFCNQRLRFVRVFPLDAGSFVIQMDLMLRNATREYVKFNFGLWSMLFKQVLYELIGSGREALVHAAEVYAVTDRAQHYVSTVMGHDDVEGPANAEPSLGQSGETPVYAETPKAEPHAAILAAAAEASSHEHHEPVEDTASVVVDPASTVQSEAPQTEPDTELMEADVYEARSENVMMMADPAEGKDEAQPDGLGLPPTDAEPFAVTLLENPLGTDAEAPQTVQTEYRREILHPL